MRVRRIPGGPFRPSDLPADETENRLPQSLEPEATDCRRGARDCSGTPSWVRSLDDDLGAAVMPPEVAEMMTGPGRWVGRAQAEGSTEATLGLPDGQNGLPRALPSTPARQGEPMNRIPSSG